MSSAQPPVWRDEILFGWLPKKQALGDARFRIEPMVNYDEAVSNTLSADRIYDDWFYPLLSEESPPRPVMFRLPATHKLLIDDSQDGRHRISSLVVLLLGFLEGMRLVPNPWWHFYRVPTKLHKLQDFYVETEAIRRILNLGLDFWIGRSSDLRRLLIGALHWHSFGRTYEHAFEVFQAQYLVLDACWRIHQELNVVGHTSHARRLEVMAADYGMTLPDWARTNSAGKSELSRLRNGLFHEALWADEPIGFSHPTDVPSIHTELHRMNSRLLLAILGEREGYVASPLTPSMTLLS